MILNFPDLQLAVSSMIQTHLKADDLSSAASLTVQQAKNIAREMENRFDAGVAPLQAWAAADGAATVNAYVVAQARQGPPANTMARIGNAATAINALKVYVRATVMTLVEGDDFTRAVLPAAELAEINRLAALIKPPLAAFLPG